MWITEIHPSLSSNNFMYLRGICFWHTRKCQKALTSMFNEEFGNRSVTSFLKSEDNLISNVIHC